MREGLVEQAVVAHLRAERSRTLERGAAPPTARRAGSAQGGQRRSGEPSAREPAHARRDAARHTFVTIAFTSSGENAPSSPSSSMLSL